MNDKLIRFQKCLIDKFLFGNNIILAQLREQYLKTKIDDIVLTNCGFYIEYLEDSNIRLNLSNFVINDIEADYNDDEYAFGFNLFVRNGQISTLECFCDSILCFDEKWNIQEYSKIVLYYTKRDEKNGIIKTDNRDYKALYKKIEESIKVFKNE